MNRKEMFEYLDGGMDPLEVSIIKWKEIRDGISSADPCTCALCETNDDCDTCIVSMYTGEYGCWGTPYRDCCEKPSKYNAMRMVAFLKALRTFNPWK